MSEPFFPPPQKKDAAPYRAAAFVAPTAQVPPALRRAERVERVEPMKAAAVARDDGTSGSLVRTFLLRFAVRVGGLGVALGLLYALVWAGERGAKWTEGVWLVLGIAGFLLMPVVLFFRARRIVRFLFARGDDA